MRVMKEQKNIKVNIMQFILSIITSLFNQTFYDLSKSNQELNYFYQLLYTTDFYLEGSGYYVHRNRR